MSSVFEEKITKVYNALMNRINASIGTHNSSSSSHSDIRETLNGKQATLVSGTNIKTINNQSVLGNGDISVDISGKEDNSNKSSSIITDTGSTTKYPSVKAVEDYAVQKTTPKNISEFKTLLDNASTGDTITLTDDYIVTNSFGYILEKNITIDGNGHTINANNNTFTFQFVSTKTLKIENCNFINIKVTGDLNSFIGNPMASSTIIFNNCIFDKGSVKKCLFYIKTGKIKINNCLFKNISLNTEGQIIYIFRSDSEIYNTIFENNTITPIYIKNTSLQNNIIKDCVFNNNMVAVLNESAESYQNAILENNLFLQTGDTLTGCVNKNYLTTHQDITGKVNVSDIQDNLTSTDTNKPLSAKQGKALKGLIDAKADSVHTHSTSDITDLPTIPNNLEDLTLGTGVVQTNTGIDVMGYDDTTNTLYWGLGALSLNVIHDEVFYNSYEIATKGDIPVVTGKENSANKVSSWSATTNNTRYPSEKLVKDTLDTKANISDLGATAFSNDYTDLDNLPSIPSASTTVPSADTSSGSYGSGTTYARSNHTHPKSSLYAEATHNHTKSQITDFPSLSTVATTGNYSDLNGIPSTFTPSSHTHDDRYYTETEVDSLLDDKADASDLSPVAFSNDYGDLSNIPSSFTPSSHLHGNINNDGTITTVKTIGSNTNVGADYFIIRDNNDSNSTKSANVLDVLNKIVLDLIDEG